MTANAAIKTDSSSEALDDRVRTPDVKDNALLQTAEKSEKHIPETIADGGIIVDKVLSCADSKEKVGLVGNSDEMERNTADVPCSAQDKTVAQAADKPSSYYDNFTKQANNNVQDIQQGSQIGVVTEISVLDRTVDVADSNRTFIARYSCQISQASDLVDGLCVSAMKQDLDDSLVTALHPVERKTVSPEADRAWLDSVSGSDSEGRDACPLHATQGIQSTRYVYVSICISNNLYRDFSAPYMGARHRGRSNRCDI